MSLMLDEELEETYEQEESYVPDDRIGDFSSTLDSPSPSALLLDRISSHTSPKCDFAEAKSYLLKCSGSTNDSLWNHLSEVIRRVLEERPANVIDYFEEFSSRVKEEQFATRNNHIQKLFLSPFNIDYARRNIDLMKSVAIQLRPEENDNVAAEELGEEDEAPRADRNIGFLQFMSYFREAGVGLSCDEAYMVNLSLLKLQNTKPVETFRFWGKIFGLKKDYLIAECELNKNEITRRKEEKQEGLAKDEDQKQKDEEEQLQKEQANEDKNRESTERVSEIDEKEIPTKEIPIPLREQFKRPKTQEPLEKPEVEIEAEPYGEGVNKKVYFVCNDFGEDWIEMPNATPMQIQVSRKIKRYFTGDLESEVNVYPKFPGKEKNYLRAQIARISSSTHISPLGFYTFGEKGEEEEDEEKDEDEEEEDGKNSFIENSQFTPIPMKDLTDTTLSFWVHHSNHLLKQGRATFWRQKKIKSGEEQEEAEEEEEQEDEEENIEEEVAETVIPLLSPLSEDKSLETTAIWSTRQTSIYAKENAVAFVCSNLWPGAYAFASGRSYGNIYMGWGHKYLAYGFSPTPLPFPEDEYEIGPEVMEIADPTPEMEKEWEESQKKKELENMASEEETEGGEDEEEDEEEDED